MNYFDELTLNDQTYFKDDLVKLVKAKLGEPDISDFKKSLYTFIGDCISDKDTITVNTSGTTGIPKAITFRKQQFISSAQMTCSYFNLGKNSKGLLCLSPAYIAGKMMIVRAFISGMNLVTLEPSDKPLLGAIGKIDFAAFVPLQVKNLVEDTISRRKFETIRNIIIGGAPVSPSLEEKLQDFTNNIYATFAMTETLSHIALKRLSGKTKNNNYFALQGVYFEKDERNCLIVNAPLVSDSPVVTNDVIELYDSAHFRWLGRYDNVINSGGVKIQPETVENKIASVMGDTRFFIASLPDERLSQKVIMVVEGEEFNKKDINAKIENILSKYEKPKEFYQLAKFVETPTGKIKKNDTLKHAQRI